MDTIVSFEIQIEGNPIPQSVQIESILCYSEVGKASSAEVRFLLPMEEESLSLTTNPFPPPGTGIEISAGYNSENSLIFSGKVEEQMLLCMPAFGGISLILHCQSDAALPSATSSSPETVLQLTLGDTILSMERQWNGNTQPMTNPGNVSCMGTALVQPGKAVLLENVLPPFGGEALISSVRHDIKDGNWKTTLGLGQ